MNPNIKAHKGYHVVWRIEHAKDYHGPYLRWFTMNQKLNKFREFVSDLHLDAAHPTPYCDGLPEVNPADFCGFFDFDSFIKWFDEGLRAALTDHGFRLRAYLVREEDVSSVGYSGQCFFNRDGASVAADYRPDHFDEKQKEVA